MNSGQEQWQYVVFPPEEWPVVATYGHRHGQVSIDARVNPLNDELTICAVDRASRVVYQQPKVHDIARLPAFFQEFAEELSLRDDEIVQEQRRTQALGECLVTLPSALVPPGCQVSFYRIGTRYYWRALRENQTIVWQRRSSYAVINAEERDRFLRDLWQLVAEHDAPSSR